MKIDENFRLLYDDNNVTLQFFEQREKIKKKTKEVEIYEYTENFYFSNVKQALINYVNKKLKGSDSILDLVLRIEKLENNIEILIKNKINK